MNRFDILPKDVMVLNCEILDFTSLLNMVKAYPNNIICKNVLKAKMDEIKNFSHINDNYSSIIDGLFEYMIYGDDGSKTYKLVKLKFCEEYYASVLYKEKFGQMVFLDRDNKDWNNIREYVYKSDNNPEYVYSGIHTSNLYIRCNTISEGILKIQQHLMKNYEFNFVDYMLCRYKTRGDRLMSKSEVAFIAHFLVEESPMLL